MSIHIDVSMSREKNNRVRRVGPDPIPSRTVYGSNFKYFYHITAAVYYTFYIGT